MEIIKGLYKNLVTEIPIRLQRYPSDFCFELEELKLPNYLTVGH